MNPVSVSNIQENSFTLNWQPYPTAESILISCETNNTQFNFTDLYSNWGNSKVINSSLIPSIGPAQNYSCFVSAYNSTGIIEISSTISFHSKKIFLLF